MYCGNCGKEIPDGAAFCPECGFKVKPKKAGDKSMILALIISFFLTGLGIAYVGNKKKGITLFLVFLIFYILSRFMPICFVISSIIWAYGLFETYNQVKKANGVSNPNLIKDIKGFSTPKKVASIVVIAFVFLIILSGLIVALMPTPDYTVSDYSSSDSSYSSGSGYSSSGGSEHYHTVVGDRESLAYSDPDSYYDHYEYGDNYDIDDYLESEGYD